MANIIFQLSPIMQGNFTETRPNFSSLGKKLKVAYKCVHCQWKTSRYENKKSLILPGLGEISQNCYVRIDL